MIEKNPAHNHERKNHRKGDRGRNFCVYTVYDNKTDFPIIVGGTADECAKALGMKIESFYHAVWRMKNGNVKRLHIEKQYLDEEEGTTDERT